VFIVGIQKQKEFLRLVKSQILEKITNLEKIGARRWIPAICVGVNIFDGTFGHHWQSTTSTQSLNLIKKHACTVESGFSELEPKNSDVRL